LRFGGTQQGVSARGRVAEALLRQIELEPRLARFRLEARPQLFGRHAVLALQAGADVVPLLGRVRVEYEGVVDDLGGLPELRQHALEALGAEEAPRTDHVGEEVDSK